MSFSFNFGGDDIEDDSPTGDLSETELAEKVEQSCTISTPHNLITPKRHDFSELLSSLPSQLSYNILSITSANPTLPEDNFDLKSPNVLRRSLFDIRAQLMAESNPEENEHDNLLAGLEAGDLSTGVYEGGFKTWECAVDLASFVADIGIDKGNWHVIELGAGSAIPSLIILQCILASRSPHPVSARRRRLRLTLCDYNEDVLRLATAPNVFLTCLFGARSGIGLELPDLLTRKDTSDGDREGDIDLESLGPEYTHNLRQELLSQGIEIDFISGAWGSDFVDLLKHDDRPEESGNPSESEADGNTLILASETIYSPESIPLFIDTVMSLLSASHGNSRALVAAKKVYFGVGGGVDEFVDILSQRGGTPRVVREIDGVGVGRVILEVTKEG